MTCTWYHCANRGKKPLGTIDITPTWSAVLPIYLAVLSNTKASADAWQAANEELARMAMLADKWEEANRK